jgi:hypothetical protein
VRRYRWAIFFVIALGCAAAANNGSPLSIVLVVVLACVAILAIVLSDTPRRGR